MYPLYACFVHPCDVGHVDDHVLHVHVYIVPTMLTELLYPLQNGNTPLHLAARGGHTTCVEHLLSIPGIVVNIKDEVVSWCSLNTYSWCIECFDR